MKGLIEGCRYGDVAAAIAATIGYILLATGTIMLTNNGHGISAIWPANALLLAIILPIPARRWPIYFAMAFAGNVASNYLTYGSLPVPLCYAMVNLSEVAVAGLLLQWGRVAGSPLEDIRSVLRFAGSAGLTAPALSALGGGAIVHFLMGQPFWLSCRAWYTANALGLLIFTPIFSGIISGDFARWVRQMDVAARIEAVAILAFVIATCLITFTVVGYPVLFVMTAPVMLATFRLGQFGTKISLIILAVIGVTCTMFGHGPIAAMMSDPGQRALFIQFYLAIMLMSSLPVSAELNARRALARRLGESEASLRLLASESADALVRLDDRGNCIQSSGATAMLLGVEARALVGSRLSILVDERDRRALDDSFVAAMVNPGTVSYCEFRPRDRTDDWLECTLRALVDDSARVYGAIGAIRDVTMRKERELSLSLAASTDSLTGALNHAAFMAHLDHALAHPNIAHLALIMVDIDHFKQVNDNHGHPAGDRVLVELCTQVRALLRDHDVIGRLGGDELAILLEGTAEELALSIAEAIRIQVSEKPIHLGAEAFHRLSISCGVAQAFPGISRDELLRKADRALYQAKGSGRDRVVISAL